MSWPNYVVDPAGSEFSTLSAAYAQLITDWNANGGGTPVITCVGGDYGGTDGALVDRVQLSTLDPVPDGVNFVTIEAQSYNGLTRGEGNTSAFEIHTDNSSAPTISVQIPYAVIRGIVARNISGTVSPFTTYVAGNNATIDSCVGSSSTTTSYAITLNGANCTAINNRGVGVGRVILISGLDCVASNNTAIGDQGRIVGSGDGTDALLYNNAINQFGVGFTNAASDKNASINGTPPGLNAITGLSVADDFEDATGNPPNLKPTLTGVLYDVGVDLSGTFTKDITGGERQGWDIGAWAYSTGGAPSENEITFTTEPPEFTARDATSRTGSATISGNWVGDQPASVEWRAVNTTSRVLLVDWNTAGMDAPDAGGTWSGTIAVTDNITDPGDSIEVQVRYSDDTGTTASSTSAWRIVRYYSIIGESNAEKWASTGTSLVPNADAWQFVTNQGHAALSSTGSGNVQFANEMIESDGVPTVIMNYGVGGRGLYPESDGTRWLNQTGTSPYGQWLQGIGQATDECEGIVWSQGEKDAQDPFTGYQNYLDSLGTFFGRCRAATTNKSVSTQLPVVMNMLGIDDLAPEGGATDIQWGEIRQAQLDYYPSDFYTYATAIYDLPDEGGIYLNEAGYIGFATRCAQVFKQLNGDATYSACPTITSVGVLNSTQLQINIQQDGGTDITPTNPAPISGFEVSQDDFATILPMSEVIRTGTDTVRITMSSALTGDFKVRYMAQGVFDYSAPVKDNTALQLPLMHIESISGSAAATKSVTVPLTDSAGVPFANLTNLRWSWFDQSNAGQLLAPTDQGITGTTDASGVFTRTLTGTALSGGQTGWLVVTDSTGNVGFDHKCFSGPVLVAE